MIKMPRTRLRIIPILLILAVGGLAQGCSSQNQQKDLQSFLTNEISDSNRSEMLLSLSALLDEQVTAMTEDIGRYDQRIREANLLYTNDTPLFVRLFAEMEEKRVAHQDLILITFLEMRDVATPEEWTELSELQLAWVSSSSRNSSPL